ncbi:MAG: acetate--CoA ligase family protein [Spirochaetes bacterium]|nr:acetate--CoA ligase family protein [Spirochaetota bacterium]
MGAEERTKRTHSAGLEKLLNPHTVAVIGASPKEDRIGGIILKELTRSHCLLYPVNPKYQALRGLRCYASVLDVPDRLDLAVITIPASGVPNVLEECGLKRIPYAIVVAGGFGETGEEGKRLQDRLVEIRYKYGIRILGPNTLGVFFPEQSFDTIFVEHGDKSLAGGGGTAVISQSGSVGIEALGLASNIGFGLRTFVGLGNKCDLDELDFLNYFAKEPGTRLIAFYLENINEGRQFLKACRTVSQDKPIVGLKAGRTASGASAVSSHTGRLAGMDLVVEGAFRQYGILRVQDDEELTDVCRALETCPLPQGNRVAVLSPAGGYGVICSDYIETPHSFTPLQMARLLPETEQRIRSVTLPFASCHNPVDITASASGEMYGQAMEAILQDPGVDILICLVFWSPPGIEDDLLDIIARRVKGSNKPVLVFTTYGPFTDRYLLEFWKRGVVGYSSIERTVRAARFLVERSMQLERFALEKSEAGARKEPSPPLQVSVSRPKRSIRRVVEQWLLNLKEPGKPDEYEAKDLLRRFGIPVPRGVRVPPFLSRGQDSGLYKMKEEAVKRGMKALLPKRFTFPAVVKVCGASFLHKTELGGVRIGVLKGELEAVLSDFQHRFPGAFLLVEEQVDFLPPELLVGGLEDPQFGMALILGAGGVLTEVYKDVTSRLCPLMVQEAERMLSELRIRPLFEGYRGLPFDRNGLVQLLVGVSELLAASEGVLSQVDLNPVVYSRERGWVVLDAKIVLCGIGSPGGSLR